MMHLSAKHAFCRSLSGRLARGAAALLAACGNPESEDANTAVEPATSAETTMTEADNTTEVSAEDREAELHRLSDADVASIQAEELAGFKYTEHPDNVALALKVCESLGVERQVALRGMWEASPDPGAMTEHEMDFFGRAIAFVNGFAANDPVSTEQIWRSTCKKYADRAQRIAIFNCRADRPDRSKELARSFVSWPQADHVVLMGTGTYLFAREASRLGFDSTKLVFAEGLATDELFERVIDLIPGSALVMGMGNVGGQGLSLVRYFHNRSYVSPRGDGPPPSSASWDELESVRRIDRRNVLG